MNPTFFFNFPKHFLLLTGTAVLLGLGIHKYQDQIQELTGQVTQPIKDALGPYLAAFGAYLASGKDNVLVFLGDVKEKVLNLPSTFSSTSDVQDTGPSTPTIPLGSRSMADKVKDYLGNTEPESGE